MDSKELKFINAHGKSESLGLCIQPARASARELIYCTICEFEIKGVWYITTGPEYKVCSTCFDRYVQPISKNQLAPEVEERLVSPYVKEMEVYNAMTHSLYSDLTGLGLSCKMCSPNGEKRPARWAYGNTYNGRVHACHIVCVVERIGANRSDNATINYETNPFWKAVGRIALVAFKELAKNLVPSPFDSAMSIILKLRAYQVVPPSFFYCHIWFKLKQRMSES